MDNSHLIFIELMTAVLLFIATYSSLDNLSLNGIKKIIFRVILSLILVIILILISNFLDFLLKNNYPSIILMIISSSIATYETLVIKKGVIWDFHLYLQLEEEL